MFSFGQPTTASAPNGQGVVGVGNGGGGGRSNNDPSYPTPRPGIGGSVGVVIVEEFY